MKRREFLQSGTIASASLAFAKPKRFLSLATASENWRTFQVTTRVEVLKPSGTTRIWVPAALLGETAFQKTLGNTFNCEGGTAKLIESKSDSLGIMAAEFPARVRPTLTVTSRIATKDRAVDLTAPAAAPSESHAELEHFLRPTKLLPTDGIVKQTASEITQGAKTDVDKARAIYEWIVENTFRNPKTRGCGVGDIRFMLESKDLGGKCADLNALFVGLARAAGLPARTFQAKAESTASIRTISNMRSPRERSRLQTADETDVERPFLATYRRDSANHVSAVESI